MPPLYVSGDHWNHKGSKSRNFIKHKIHSYGRRVRRGRLGKGAGCCRRARPPDTFPPLSRRSLSITIRARGSGSAGGVGGGTTGGSSISNGGSSPHALFSTFSTTAAAAATFPNPMGDWEELKRKVRGIESKLEVRGECAGT